MLEIWLFITFHKVLTHYSNILNMKTVSIIYLVQSPTNLYTIPYYAIAKQLKNSKNQFSWTSYQRQIPKYLIIHVRHDKNLISILLILTSHWSKYTIRSLRSYVDDNLFAPAVRSRRLVYISLHNIYTVG